MERALPRYKLESATVSIPVVPVWGSGACHTFGFLAIAPAPTTPSTEALRFSGL